MQAKRYSPHRAIGLEAVQALTAVVDDENANRGMFVTTSRYLPSATEFAARQNHRIVLKTSEDIVGWSRSATDNINRKLIDACAAPGLKERIDNAPKGNIGKIFHTTWGYNMIHNDFAVCVLESPGAGIYYL